MKKVMVTVKTILTDGDQSDKMELTAEGEFSIKDGSYLIKYQDMFLSGPEQPITTRIKVSKDNAVTVTRTGAYKSRSVIEQNKRCQSLYATPYGNMTMGFFGKKIENRLNDSGGELELVYTVDVNNSEINRNEMFIKIKEV